MIHVATILGAHGIKGEVKLRSLTSRPQDFASYGPLFNASGHSFEVTRSRPAKGEFICTLATVTDRTAAVALRGVALFIPREKLPPPKPGEIYLADVQGKLAVADGKTLGHIVGFQNFGAGELIELEGGTLIPVSMIATISDKVTLQLPEGFLDKE